MGKSESSRTLDIDREHRRRDRRRGGFFSLGSLIVGIILGVLGWVVIGNAFSGLNPFGTETHDYSAPTMLEEMRDMSEFHAAQAQLQVTIDQEDDVKYVPSIIAGERVQYVAVGYVDGFVDFSGLSDDAVTVDEENNSVAIDLPAAQLGRPVIDMNLSHVMNRDRGLLDRLGGVFVDNPTGEQELIQLAQQKMYSAAEQSDLIGRTEANTADMLQSWVRAMGFAEVTITFDGEDPQTFAVPTGDTIGRDAPSATTGG